MEKSQKTYKNSIRSKKLIRNAVIKLLEQKKNINAIAITEIVSLAKINRGTFYNHYENIIDVINEIEDELMSGLSEKMKYVENSKNYIQEFVKILTDGIKENEDDYRILVKYIPKYILDDLKSRFYKELSQNYKFADDENSNLIMYMFLSNGVIGTFVDYLEGKMETSLDEISTNISATLQNIVYKKRAKKRKM